MKKLLLGAVLLLSFVADPSSGQVPGDYRSKSTGNWSDASSWEAYDGSVWSNAVTKPSVANSVYIQYSHIITLTANEACNDFHTAVTDGGGGTAAGIVKLQSFTLELNGKLRSYSGAIGTIPGVNASGNLSWGSTRWPIQATNSTSGLLKIVGNSRALTNSGEWGAGSGTAASYSPSVEVALSAGQTISLATNIKFSNWTFTSGTINAQTSTVSADNGTAAAGNITIGSAATYMSATTSTQNAFQRTGSTPIGTLTVNGLLILTGAAPLINATTVVLNGTVQYDAAGAQTFAKPGTGGAAITSYTNIIASNAGVKTTPGSGSVVWVAGTRTTSGSASFALGAGDSWGAYFKSLAAGDLADLNTWGDASDGTGTHPPDFTSANQIFSVRNRATSTHTTNWSVSGTNSKIIIGDGITPVTLTVGSGGVMSSANGIDVIAGSTFEVANGSTVGGSVNVSTNGVLNLTGSSIPTLGTITGSVLFNNPAGFVLSGSLILPAAGTYTLAQGNILVNSPDVLTVNGIFDCGTNTIQGSGTFTLATGATLRIGSLEGISSSGLTGNITTAVRNFDATANYTYKGTGTLLTTGDGLPATVNSLTINLTNSTDIIALTSPVATTGNLTFTNGRIRLGTNDLTLGASGGGSANSYAITNGTGSLKRTTTTNTSTKTFYLGSEAEYRKAVVTFSSGTATTTTLSARYVTGDAGSVGYPSGIAHHYAGGYWVISSSVPPSPQTYQLDLETVGVPGISTINTVRILKRANNTLAWEFAGTSANSGTTVSESGLADFSEFAIGSGDDNALPIQLASFVATPLAEGRVQLDWLTLSEVNNYGFEVQRSLRSNSEFATISPLLPGHGTSTEPHMYHYVDATAGSADWYYRLKQIDLNQTVHFTEPIRVSSPTSVVEKAPIQFELSQNYPNPFNPSTEMKFSVEKTGPTKLEVFNIVGQRVATIFDDVAEAGKYYRVQLNGAELPSGIYFSRLQSGHLAALKKLVLLK